ncbi:MAG: ATPase, T2SS/T4P/T4SS family, partial [Clostridiales bacterium]
IHQREVGRDVISFSSALRSALREDPDVILVGEMRDFETISAAVTAAETGHLVLSTLHTTGAARTVDRIIDIFPPHGQTQIRTQLAGTLRGVITQQLLPLAVGGGRIAATEIMVGTDAVANLIREGKCHQLNSLIQSGGGLGMHTLDGCLAAYVKQGLIKKEIAEQFAANPGELRQLMG